MRSVDCLLLLWTIPEPVIDGQRLRLNSLTGAYSAANVMENLGKNFCYVIGSTFADETVDEIKTALLAAKLKYSLTKLNLLQVGNAPAGYGFGKGIETELMRVFGVNLVSVEARELMEAANSYDEDDVRHFIFDVQNIVPNLFNIDRENLFAAGRLFKAYFDYCNQNDIGAVSSCCMHDFINVYGTPICAVLSLTISAFLLRVRQTHTVLCQFIFANIFQKCLRILVIPFLWMRNTMQLYFGIAVWLRRLSPVRIQGPRSALTISAV